MHPMFRNWNPRTQAQVNNTLRLAMAECPDDVPELIKIVKNKGFDVPSGLTPATGWGSFESRKKVVKIKNHKCESSARDRLINARTNYTSRHPKTGTSTTETTVDGLKDKMDSFIEDVVEKYTEDMKLIYDTAEAYNDAEGTINMDSLVMPYMNDLNRLFIEYNPVANGLDIYGLDFTHTNHPEKFLMLSEYGIENHNDAFYMEHKEFIKMLDVDKVGEAIDFVMDSISDALEDD